MYAAYREDGCGELVLRGPVVHARDVTAANGASHAAALTIKPVLSFRHARQCDACAPSADCRTELCGAVQCKLRGHGLAQFAASAGGRSSIDIMKFGITKKYALCFLIEVGARGVHMVGTWTWTWDISMVEHGMPMRSACPSSVCALRVHTMSMSVPMSMLHVCMHMHMHMHMHMTCDMHMCMHMCMHIPRRSA